MRVFVAVPIGLLMLALAGCSGGGTTASPTPSAAATVVPTPVAPATAQATPAATATASVAPTAIPTASGSPAPATFELTVTGDENVTGEWSTSYGVTCDNPSFDGLDILLFATSPDGAAVVLLTLTSASVSVSERAGAGESYTERDFAGNDAHSVTNFDAAHGASFDSGVGVVPGSTKPGTLGTITHVHGSVDCGGQMAGTSTVNTAGSTAEGAVTGPFESFRVSCNHSAAYGNGVQTTAIITAGTSPTLLIINIPANGNSTIFSTVKDLTVAHTYMIDPAGTQTITPTGAQIDADYDEVVAAGATPHVIHLSGELVCGTTTTT